MFDPLRRPVVGIIRGDGQDLIALLRTGRRHADIRNLNMRLVLALGIREYAQSALYFLYSSCKKYFV